MPICTFFLFDKKNEDKRREGNNKEIYNTGYIKQYRKCIKQNFKLSHVLLKNYYTNWIIPVK